MEYSEAMKVAVRLVENRKRVFNLAPDVMYEAIRENGEWIAS